MEMAEPGPHATCSRDSAGRVEHAPYNKEECGEGCIEKEDRTLETPVWPFWQSLRLP